ncbi:SMI1/KNR4 family protein [Amycolatopsis orientalis]|uniref:SMI1/KNR4 family protein n=1 Tax=Amycolatopsis orientalis TaxID=31958 RepID=UPI0009DF44BA|nr:SMI1/KNR4 family protein [Amycolatopsis orientalis]
MKGPFSLNGSLDLRYLQQNVPVNTDALAAKLARLRAIEEDLPESLHHLRRYDDEFVIFGAYTHLYRSEPQDEAEISAVEADLGVEFPAGYRDFLRRVGAGAGPYHGLLDMAELREWSEDLKPAEEFPFTAADAHQVHQEWRDWQRDPEGRWFKGIEVGPDLSGCVAISEQGCSGFTMLVTTGELAGSLWDMDEWGWMTAHAARSGRPGPDEVIDLGPTPTFEAWYDAWLTESLKCLTP